MVPWEKIKGIKVPRKTLILQNKILSQGTKQKKLILPAMIPAVVAKPSGFLFCPRVNILYLIGNMGCFTIHNECRNVENVKSTTANMKGSE